MLDPRLRRILTRLPVAALAALALWLAGGDEVWGRALVPVAEWGLRLGESPKVSFLSYEDGEALIRRSDLSTRSALPAVPLQPITANLVLLLALTWATPGAWTTRGVLGTVAAAAALLASHVLHLLFTIQTVYAMDLGAWSEVAYRQWQREVFGGFRYFFDIALKYALPPAFWAAFVLPVFWTGRDEEPADAEAKPWKRKRRR